MPPEDDSALERMQKRLYDSKNPVSTGPAPLDLSARTGPVPRAWTPEPLPPPDMPRPKKKMPLSVKFLLAAVAFFVVAGAIAAYLLLIGGRGVSTDNINITIDGPSTVSGGDTGSFLITIENHNPVAITNTDFSIAFPPGTRSADDVTKPLIRYDDTLGDLAAGQAVTRTVTAVLFGAENQTLTIPVKLEYKTAGSNAVFVKEKDDVITVSSSPVSVTATAASQVSSGQAVTFSLSVRSNAAKPLTDIALAAQYPFGFSVASTSLPSDNGLFTIGTLDPGQEKKLTVTGTLSGSNNDERVFHWTAGSTASSTNGALGISYASAETDITITQPFLDLGLTVNGDSSASPIIAPGHSVQGVVSWKNTLTGDIRNAQITVQLGGSALDPSSVTAQNGFYQSSNGTIRFDSTTSNGLADLAPGDTGQGTFTFTTKPQSALAGTQSPSITFAVSASGSQTSQSGIPSTLNSTVTRTVKVSTGVRLSSQILKTSGPFSNTGPFPPTAGTPTTYSVVLTAANGVNNVAGATVTVTLPSYVTFTGLTSPADGSITYSDTTRTVKWAVGDLAPSSSHQGAFQVSLLPSVSQKGLTPTLVSSQTLNATDRFTQSAVTSTAPALTTDASSDPAYRSGSGTVQ